MVRQAKTSTIRIDLHLLTKRISNNIEEWGIV